MTDSLSQATKSTIMVVDDDQHMVKLLRARLEQREFNVMCAYSGLQALADLEKQKPDLILLDIIMPEMDGFEVLAMMVWPCMLPRVKSLQLYHWPPENTPTVFPDWLALVCSMTSIT